jgi:iron complex outermembrane receptor protein
MRTRLLATSMITSAALLAISGGAAYAADPNQPSNVGEVVITGTRIPAPNLTSVSPIQSVGQQEFKLEGHTDVIDVLNNLPQNFQNNTADFSNTGNPLSSPGGLSTADLRGLGPQRTLVLVNGRRLGIGDANTGNNNPAPDLDQIPAAMIDHVEVVTGGASATYGSDAIAGVVNFILKKDFEGIQFDGTIGENQHDQQNGVMQHNLRSAPLISPIHIPGSIWDGLNGDASIIMGANAPDGKGNATVFFEYHNQDPITMDHRDFSACKLKTGNALGSSFCTGSANSNYWAPISHGAPGCPGGVPPGGSSTCTVVGHAFLPWPQVGSSPPAYFNSNPYQYLSRSDTRYSAGYMAHYDLMKELNFYSEFNFMNDRSVTEIAPSGSFIGGNPFDPTGTGGYLINCNNPLMTGAQATIIGCSAADIANPNAVFKDVLLGRRNIEGGPRISTYEHMNFRAVFGARGDLGDAWHYDAYTSYYYTSLWQNNSNYLAYSKIGKGLQVVNVGGVPTCISVVNGSDPKCVPYNIFQDGGVTPAALKYLNIIGTEYGTVEEAIVEGDLSGDLGKYGIKSPWATDGVGVAAGFDWRRDTLKFVPDATVGSGDLAGGSGVGSAINRGIGVWEGYGEVRIPVLQDMAFAKLFEVDGGFRYSSYDTGPTPWTYKVGLQWSPNEDLRFRASYQLAIRAPSIIELFNPVIVTQSNSFGQAGDPCAGGSPSFSAAQCALTGVTPAQYGHITQCPAGQCNVSTGGNVVLKPEQADTYSVGLTFTPHFIHGLTASIDWWDIHETGFVGTIPPNIIVTSCATSGQLCSLVHRSPSTGALFGPSDLVAGGYVVGQASNIAGGEESGIDFQGSYRMDLEDMGAKGMGSLAFDLNGALLLKNSTVLPGLGTYDCTGLFGSKCQTVNPDWRHTFRLTWNTPWNILASLQWRYIGQVSLDTNTSQPIITNHKHNAFNATLPDESYLDLAAAWRVNSNVTIRGGINNILDQDPPLVSADISGTGTPNSYPTYDLLGREFFLSATLKY